MFAVKDKRTGKYLKSFSGSYNNFRWHTEYRLTKYEQLPREPGQLYGCSKVVYKPTAEEIHAAMFCLPSPDGAKLYHTRGGVATSFGNGYRKIDRVPGGYGYEVVPMAEAKPWLEVVDVQIFERRRTAARKGAATRKPSRGRKLAR